MLTTVETSCYSATYFVIQLVKIFLTYEIHLIIYLASYLINSLVAEL
jgi:hypothetical protein